MGRFVNIGGQYQSLREKYPYLYNDGARLIKGTIFIRDDDIEDSYEVEIGLSDDYPKQIPTVKEIESKIPQDYHHNPPENTLCLEVPFTVWEIFRQDETLLNFVDSLLVPYLFSYSHFSKYGKTLFGEHAHGAEGMLNDYKKRFNEENDTKALALLRVLAENDYRGHYLCPCGAQKKIRNCHGDILLTMKTVGYNFMLDYIKILEYLKEKKRKIDVLISTICSKGTQTNKGQS